MTAPGPLPSLSELQAWPTSHFDEIADWCEAEADRWESCFAEAHQLIREADWEGQAHDNAVHRIETDLGKARGAASGLRDSAPILRLGAENERFAKAAALRAVGEAREAGYTVNDDLSVIDPTKYTSFEQYVARRNQGREIAADIRYNAASLVTIDQNMAAKLPAVTAPLRDLRFTEAPMNTGGGTPGKGHNKVQLVDNVVPGPLQPGQAPDPANPFIGDQRFGHWEDVPPPPPYTGAHPPPLQPQYRPYPDGTPQKIGPTTGMYTPGKTWIGDIDAPAVQGNEEYRFKLAGEQATTVTRVVNENGHPQQQRWVQSVYEYQRNTSLTFGGDVGMKGIEGEQGDIGGLPPIQNIDHTWKPISLPQIATLSAGNMDTTYYLPDGCGGSVNFVGGVAQGSTGLPPSPPIMTRPR